MRKYELTVVVDGRLADKDREKTVQAVKSLMKDVKTIKEDVWGLKPLSYPIKKAASGYYVMWELEGETVPVDLERRLLQNESVLRHLLVRTK